MRKYKLVQTQRRNLQKGSVATQSLAPRLLLERARAQVRRNVCAIVIEQPLY